MITGVLLIPLVVTRLHASILPWCAVACVVRNMGLFCLLLRCPRATYSCTYGKAGRNETVTSAYGHVVVSMFAYDIHSNANLHRLNTEQRNIDTAPRCILAFFSARLALARLSTRFAVRSCIERRPTPRSVACLQP